MVPVDKTDEILKDSILAKDGSKEETEVDFIDLDAEPSSASNKPTVASAPAVITPAAAMPVTPAVTTPATATPTITAAAAAARTGITPTTAAKPATVLPVHDSAASALLSNLENKGDGIDDKDPR